MYKNNREETNSEEYKTLIEQFNNYVKRINTDFMLEDFSKRLENNEVKNDGTDSLLKIIDKYILKDNSEFIKIIDKGTIMYRARIIEHNHINKHYLSINDEKLMGYDESNSREAPLGIGNEGRNNIKGMSYLYLANNVETACSEVKPFARQLISVARFRLLKDIKVIDLSNLQNEFVYGVTDESDKIDLSYLFTRIMTSYYVPINHLNEYKYTQFITDYIRKSRIDGIIYKSFYSYNGSNYTIFNSSRDIIEFIDSKIMLLQSERRTFLDFNDDKVIHAKTIVGASYDKKSSDIMKKNLRNKIMLE